MATVPSTDNNIVTELLIGLNPSNMFHLIDNHVRIENLVRNNLEIFINAYRNHPDILDNMISGYKSFHLKNIDSLNKSNLSNSEISIDI